MNRVAIKEILLVEDNAGDARLLREMVGDQGLHTTELTHVETMLASALSFVAGTV